MSTHGELVDGLRQLIDAIERERLAEVELASAVVAARLAGASWQTIGNCFGISRQAAQQRFGTPPR